MTLEPAAAAAADAASGGATAEPQAQRMQPAPTPPHSASDEADGGGEDDVSDDEDSGHSESNEEASATAEGAVRGQIECGTLMQRLMGIELLPPVSRVRPIMSEIRSRARQERLKVSVNARATAHHLEHALASPSPRPP